jgi:hypothetical protein
LHIGATTSNAAAAAKTMPEQKQTSSANSGTKKCEAKTETTLPSTQEHMDDFYEQTGASSSKLIKPYCHQSTSTGLVRIKDKINDVLTTNTALMTKTALVTTVLTTTAMATTISMTNASNSGWFSSIQSVSPQWHEQFHFWEPVYFASTKALFKQEQKPPFASEIQDKGRTVGFAECTNVSLSSDDTQTLVRLDPTEGETPTLKLRDSPKLDDPTKVGTCDFDRTSTTTVKMRSSSSMAAANRYSREKIDQNFLETNEKEQRFGATTFQKLLEPEHAKEVVVTPCQSLTSLLQRFFLLDNSGVLAPATSSNRAACEYRSARGYLDFFKRAPSQWRNSFILEYVKLQQKRVQCLKRGGPLTDGHRKIRVHVKWCHARLAVMAGTLQFIQVIGKDNPADILTKRCGLPQLQSLVQSLLLSLGRPLSRKGEVEAVKTVWMVI